MWCIIAFKKGQTDTLRTPIAVPIMLRPSRQAGCNRRISFAVQRKTGSISSVHARADLKQPPCIPHPLACAAVQILPPCRGCDSHLSPASGNPGHRAPQQSTGPAAAAGSQPAGGGQCAHRSRGSEGQGGRAAAGGCSPGQLCQRCLCSRSAGPAGEHVWFSLVLLVELLIWGRGLCAQSLMRGIHLFGIREVC